MTDPEPLPSDHELYQLSSCTVAPHVGSATVDTRDEIARICAENLVGGVTGGKLTALVNPGVEGKRRR